MTRPGIRPLGSTGMSITAVGFGSWAIGGGWSFGWGSQDDDESIAAIHRALDAGVNWRSTSPTSSWPLDHQLAGQARGS
jgi:aryl-alcohol dehydrogenase-like predicted oxidoreductase